MKPETTMPDSAVPSSGEEKREALRLAYLLAFLLPILTLLAVPLKVTSYGYLPVDDALRHAGFATVDKSWDDILVSDRPIPDMHVGWHKTLKAIHRLTGADPDALVVFSIVVLFWLFTIPPLFMVRRPESWIAALLIAYFLAGLSIRLFLGRPFLFHIAVLIWLLLLGDRLNEEKTPWKLCVFLAAAMALSIWWRTAWFMYALPMAAFFLARRWRAFVRLVGIWLVAMIAATILCGPKLIVDSLLLSFRVMRSADHPAMQLVSELRPFTGYGSILLLLALLAIWGHFRGRRLRDIFDTPAFYLLLIALAMGSLTAKWWLDFGVPALTVLICRELDDFLADWEGARLLPLFSPLRTLVVAVLCGFLFIEYTVDEGSRWTSSLHNEYVDISDSSIREGLPGPGGIVYSTSSRVFFQTFYKHPDAPWRYMLGFEAALMPEKDLKIFRRIQWNGGAVQCFKPWVEEMRPQDRLWVMQGMGAPAPPIPGLKWTRLTSYIWSGRKETDTETKE